MKSFTQKKEELAELKKKLAKSKLTVFTTFAREGEKGLSVAGIQTLKKGLRGAESEYVVGKKTLLDRALKEDKKAVEVSEFAGSVGVVFGYGDEQKTAKAVYDFSRKNPALKLFSAIIDGKLMDVKGFLEFAKLPSKEALIGRILGLMQYPLSSLANVLGQVAGKKI